MNTTTSPLGDGISRVSLIDSMGDDLRVANAARVSMSKESDWEWNTVTGESPMDVGQVRELSEKDQKLLNYLAKHQHWTPFSHVMFTFRIKMPIFVARQWFKHQVGFTRNEVSRRYVDDKPEFFVPKEWRKRADSVKQGSSDEVAERSSLITALISELNDSLSSAYIGLMKEHDIAPEVARMFLPQSMYTEFYETASLAGYARLCKLREDSHAQKEIQWYAQAVSELIEPLVPHSWKALMGET